MARSLDPTARTTNDVASVAGLVMKSHDATGQALRGGRRDVGPLDGHVSIVGPERVAASAFEVDRALVASASYAVGACDAVGRHREITPPHRSIDLEHLLAFCTTHVEVDGEPVPAWADLSGIYPTADGRHLQIHCNFTHHADGVVRRLQCAPTREAVAAAIADCDAFELEAQLIDDGMIGAAVRSLDEWDAHPHAVAARDLPVVSVERIGDAAARAVSDSASRDPLAGVRVLDCSRVLAGPVAGQMLAGFGADVLRLGADHLPSVPVGVISTGFGKRNASLDLRTEAGKRSMEALLEGADVWIDAYRPGAMAAHGFGADRVAEMSPGIVIVQVSAFDWVGPWAGRRGFDSIVQSTTGVRWAGGEKAVDDSGTPVASAPIGLPVQALDYATGFLAAGVASQLLSRQRVEGGSWSGRLSLLRTRNWMVDMGGPNSFVATPVCADRRFMHTVESDFGTVTSVLPFAGSIRPAPRALGTAEPAWNYDSAAFRRV